MNVIAQCNDCGGQHTVGARPLAEDTNVKTLCPTCGSSSYDTAIEVETTFTEGEIRAVLASTENVGEGTIESIEDTVGSLTLVPTLSLDRLTDIENVGQQTAKAIHEQF